MGTYKLLRGTGVYNFGIADSEGYMLTGTNIGEWFEIEDQQTIKVDQREESVLQYLKEHPDFLVKHFAKFDKGTSEMYKLHTTKDGETMMIAQMADRHLENTIKLICEEIAENVVVLTGQFSSDLDPLMQALAPSYNVESQRQSAREKVNHLYGKLLDYLFEASLRNIDVSDALQDAFQRKGRVGGRTRKTQRVLDGSAE